jgi:hypothetical protein
MPKLYAEKPFRFGRQLIADLMTVAWIALWVWIATHLYDLVMKLAVPGQKLEDAGGGLAENLKDAQDKANGIPLVGDKLGTPFGRAAEAARSIADAGQSTQDVVHDLALTLSWAIGVLPILIAIVLWWLLRMRWIRSASAANRLRRRRGGVELLALRAMTSASLRRLAMLPDDTAARWRDGDPGIIDSLAALELRRLGLRTTGRALRR